eukprot:TRINITY_DN2422_c0_g1_i1.p1 TRINITY_DN2422_c0_g1~~TRINITY_DN2422_c0_g1_i1.p1  ORF type:complete len:1327 (-),score=405.70 TRINITY_DN2422_c0_g1_i1:140-4120(-)
MSADNGHAEMTMAPAGGAAGSAAEALALTEMTSKQGGALADMGVTSPASGGAGGGLELQLLSGLSGSDMMSRFEALSRAFKSEVEGLVDQEKISSQQTRDEMQGKIEELEDTLSGEAKEAAAIAAQLRDFVGRQQTSCLAAVFGSEEAPAEPQVASVAELRRMVTAFLTANDVAQRPDLAAALDDAATLRRALAARDEELLGLRAELQEARILKTQEERELTEFRLLREKESELQLAKLSMEQLRTQLEELQEANKVLSSRASQSEAALGEKSRKVIDCVKQLEEQAEKCRVLSNENNVLRLQLGKDSDYAKVVDAPEDCLARLPAGSSAALSEELQTEERRFREELSLLQLKFPGLLIGSDNCRRWCAVQLSRQCSLYRSFLHLLQDARKSLPADVDVEFVSKTKEVDAAWTQREEEMRDQDAAFHAREAVHTKRWEEKRLELVAERDLKIKQLLEQAEKSTNKVEQQMLMQQAKLFGQRMDTQIERAWEEQKKERDERWTEHNKAKQESRQRFKEESLSVQQDVEGTASASERFQDTAKARLSAIEDAWLRNTEKESSISQSALKMGDLQECLQAAGLPRPRLPPEGLQHGGVSDLATLVDEVLKMRSSRRERLRQDVEEQTLQQLRTCVERFVQKEGAAVQAASLPGKAEECCSAPEYSKAATLKGLLQARQHRAVADTIRRQFQDYLLVLRIITLGAARLLPGGNGQAHAAAKARGARLDLPPVPPELAAEEGEASAGSVTAVTSDGVAPGAVREADAEAEKAEQMEERFLYDSIARRLLDRVLTQMHSDQRQELLDLKRANAREVRRVLQNLCQLEASLVDEVAAADLDEFRSQVKAKLLADCEVHLCEERRELSERVDADLELHVSKYRRQTLEEELKALTERRKWLTERLVVMQSQGTAAPGEKAVLQHLRAELRACELRYETRERDYLAQGGALCDDAEADAPVLASSNTGLSQSALTAQALELGQPSNGYQQPGLSSPRRPLALREPSAERFQGHMMMAAAAAAAAAASPASASNSRPASRESHSVRAPEGLPPQNRRPSSRTTSPNPSTRQERSAVLPIGRPSGQAREAASLQFPMPPAMPASPRTGTGTASDAAGPPPRSAGRPPSFGAGGGDDSPCFGGMMRREESKQRYGSPNGADGAAGFGRTDLSRDAALLGLCQRGQGDLSQPVKSPLYDWPFESPTKGSKPDSFSVMGSPQSLHSPLSQGSPGVFTAGSPRKVLPDPLPPLKQLFPAAAAPAAHGRPPSAGRRRSDSKDPYGGSGAFSAGLSLGTPAAGPLKSPRGVPPGAGGVNCAPPAMAASTSMAYMSPRRGHDIR